jgi:hypothetical protein
LCVLAETIIDLAVPSQHLLLQNLEIDAILSREPIHSMHELIQVGADDEILAFFLEGL